MAESRNCPKNKPHFFSYKLVSFKNMDAYFKAIGVPSFAISFVKKLKEVRTIEPPEEPGGEWSVVVETGRMIIIMLYPPK